MDAFTDTAFKGNPAAVCFLEEDNKDEEWLQAVAAEFSTPVTCFMTWITDSEPDMIDSANGTLLTRPGFRIRWFTPVADVRSLITADGLVATFVMYSSEWCVCVSVSCILYLGFHGYNQSYSVTIFPSLCVFEYHIIVSIQCVKCY